MKNWVALLPGWAGHVPAHPQQVGCKRYSSHRLQPAASCRGGACVGEVVCLARLNELAIVGRGVIHGKQLDGLTGPGVELLAGVLIDLDLVAILEAHDDQRILVVGVLLSDLLWRAHVIGRGNEATWRCAGHASTIVR